MHTQTYTKEQIKELQKLYPEVKIPVYGHYQYYLDTLSRAEVIKNSMLYRLDDFIKDYPDRSIASYKMQSMDKVLDLLKENLLEKFNNLRLPKTEKKYPKDNSNLKPSKYYVSIDMKSANWAIVTRKLGLPPVSFEDFLRQFDIHDFIRYSKSFRQLVLGNFNPSRIQTFQQEYMNEELLPLVENLGSVVFVSSDEICLTYDGNISQMGHFHLNLIEVLGEHVSGLRISYFQLLHKECFGEVIKIKERIPELFDANMKDVRIRELFGAPGNRFYLYLKKLIINEPIDERDLLFEAAPGQLAKWIID